MKRTFFVFRRVEAGFTLLELLIVMLIIGLLAAFVAPRMIGKVGKSKRTIAKAQIEALCTAVETYRLDTDRYPDSDAGLDALINKPGDGENWSGPYLTKRKVPNDPWGNEYVYIYPGENGDFDIIAYGADGRDGGEGDDADVTSWE